MKVYFVEKIATVSDPERYAFVNSPADAVIDGFDGVRPIQRRVPT